jgi:hypothetical protein
MPLLLNKVPPNKIYGARLAKAYESTELWYKINHYGAKQLIMAAGLIMVLSLIALIFSRQLSGVGGITILLLIVPLALVIIAAVRTWYYARSL